MNGLATILLTIGVIHNISMIIIAAVRIERKNEVLAIKEIITKEPEEKEALQKIKERFRKSTIAFFSANIILADILLISLYFS